MTYSKLKRKKCKCCGVEFMPFKSMQKVCSTKCAIEYSNEQTKKKAKQQARREKKKFNEDNMTLSDYKKKLQTIFNKFIRLRDVEKGCVSCGTPLQNRKFDAGHFYATTYEGLRFNENNVFGQCVPCNRNKHGNIHEYRKRITDRISEEELQWLDDNRHIRLKLTKYELKELIEVYKSKVKEYEKH
jgi:hypothetical protein